MTELTHFIRVYDEALPKSFCEKTLDWFESHPEQQQRNGKNIRSGLSESSWTEMDLSECSAFGFRNVINNCLRHFKAIYENECGIQPPLPDPLDLAPLIIKRYDLGGDRFQPHYDSLGPVANRYLVFLWYLNDVAEGGETAFTDLETQIKPVAGRLLIFPPYWMYRHTGRNPASEAKYILSTYCLW